MTHTYIIRKSSRSNIAPYSCGLTCAKAGVPCEHLYTDRNTALKDAEKLSKVNPVGFDVVRVARLRNKRPSSFVVDSLKLYLRFKCINQT